MVAKKASPVIQGLSLSGIDLAELRKQRQLVEQQANQAISERIDAIKTLLNDIREIAGATGVEVDLDTIGYEVADMAGTYWSSSNC